MPSETAGPGVAADEAPRPLSRRLLRLTIEVAPALVVALVLLPWIIATGSGRPWQPAMIDLDVYVAAVRDLLAGGDIYATRTPKWNLPFIYPPIAALIMVPVAWLPTWVLQIVWAVLTVVAQRLILVRAGVRRAGALALANAGLVLAFEPFRTTLGYGQVNTLLMALVVADLLPRRERSGWFPRGALIGLAAAIKLTPLAFVVFAVLVGRRAVAVWGVGTFVGLTGLGALILPRETAVFARKVLTGNLYGDPVYVGNQSVNAVFARLVGNDPTTERIALLASGLAGLLALIVAVLWWRRGQRVLAVGLVGLATCLASPLSWTHHHVWALLIAVAVLSSTLAWWPRVVGGTWSLWIALCPVLVFLPYGSGAEAGYSVGQQVVANLGPALAIALCLGLLVEAIAGSDRGLAVPTSSRCAGLSARLMSCASLLAACGAPSRPLKDNHARTSFPHQHTRPQHGGRPRALARDRHGR
ncbi:glycosyltransferase 87 family protein [Granulicoccus sp. GXG6511]|uniref:glycosyltransferase 87 family protein n=1 Tax=Granulicoccus sp. GXG6511 TaxID=3381351 RepID=UPI003D7CF8A4